MAERTKLINLGRKPGYRFFYERLANATPQTAVRFMNYGYDPVDGSTYELPLSDDLEPYRYSAQLYHYVASRVPVAGGRVLEVGCGRGGGADFLKDALDPAEMVGIDVASTAIEQAADSYGRDGLEFRVGDAEDLPFGDADFDAVVNVESSHCYGNQSRFFEEVGRVLKPGGHLLYADIRHPQRHTTDSMIKNAGMEIVEREEITPNVLRALDLDADRKRALFENQDGHRIVAWFMRRGGGLPDTKIYNMLQSGELIYLRYLASKPA